MASLNMAKVNTLFKKGYLLAGVIIAANMFVVNEMMAMNKEEISGQNNQQSFPGMYQPITYPNPDTNNINQEINKDVPAPQPEGNFFYNLFFGLLSCEGCINFFGGALFSVANNYLKWWDYNPGGYCNLRIGCLGLRSKRFLNGMLQFEGNLNLIRGGLWLIAGVIDFLWYFMKRGITNTNTAALIMLKILKEVKGNEIKFGFFYSILFLVQGFVSIPLTLHFSKFSISIYLDSLIWGLTGKILEKKVVSGVPIKGAGGKYEQIIEENNYNKESGEKNDNELKDNELNKAD